MIVFVKYCCKKMGLVKLVALFLLGTTVVVSATPENYFPHFLFKRSTTNENCTEAGVSCVNACKTLRICTPKGDSFKQNEINCEEHDISKPYCNGQTCSASKSPDCDSAASSDFECTGDGYFPDPDDCTKYHFCYGEESVEVPCEKYYVYSHDLSSCVKKRLSSDCAVIKCKSTALFEYVVYPKDASVYGLCVKGEKTTVFSCPEGQEFNVNNGKCSVACKKEGLIPAGKECSREYIRCKKISSSKYEGEPDECPGSTIFVKDKCVVGVCPSTEEESTPPTV